jgi:hypothetical protein
MTAPNAAAAIEKAQVAISQDLLHRRRFQRRAQEDLLETFDALALRLSDAAELTASGRVPMSARIEYLRAEAAHLRALTGWAAASGEEQFDVVHEALAQCRSALDASRAKLRR